MGLIEIWKKDRFGFECQVKMVCGWPRAPEEITKFVPGFGEVSSRELTELLGDDHGLLNKMLHKGLSMGLR